MARPTAAEISLSALRRNFRIIRSLLPPSSSVLAVVKADGYGHGAAPVARALSAAGARMFGVATVEEGVELREAGIAEPIVVLGGADETQAEEAHRGGLSPAVFEAGQIPYLARIAAARSRPFAVHLKIDTGMGRLGFLAAGAPAAVDRLAAEKALRVEGVMTHLSSADGLSGEDREFTRGQLAAFAGLLPRVRKALGGGVLSHAQNSAGIILHREPAFDMARPGITLYGSLPADGVGADLGLAPVMRLVTKIVSLKELPAGHPVSYGRHYSRPEARRIAVVPIGYADGYRRSFSNAASMTVMGKAAPVAGRVCMDHTMIDVTGIPGASVGTDVVVMGAGAQSADDLARIAGTIPYEILTQVGRRVPRRIVD
ncbi:MAG: alanine racemase [Gemmatimonadota bacterium]